MEFHVTSCSDFKRAHPEMKLLNEHIPAGSCEFRFIGMMLQPFEELVVESTRQIVHCKTQRRGLFLSGKPHSLSVNEAGDGTGMLPV